MRHTLARSPARAERLLQVLGNLGSYSRASETAYGDLTGTSSTDTTVDETWHTDANVQAAVVTASPVRAGGLCPWPTPPPRGHGIDVRLWFLERPQFDGQRCGPGWICGGSGFLAGAAVGHRHGATILVSSAWTSPAALGWSLLSRSSRLAHLGWMAASLVITQTETCQRRWPPRTPALNSPGGHHFVI
jgi:hypothetical protein